MFSKTVHSGCGGSTEVQYIIRFSHWNLAPETLPTVFILSVCLSVGQYVQSVWILYAFLAIFLFLWLPVCFICLSVCLSLTHACHKCSHLLQMLLYISVLVCICLFLSYCMWKLLWLRGLKIRWFRFGTKLWTRIGTPVSRLHVPGSNLVPGPPQWALTRGGRCALLIL